MTVLVGIRFNQLLSGPPPTR